MCETREYAISVKQKAWLNGAFILTALVASFTDGDIITQLHPFILTVAARLSESCRMSLHEFCAIWETLCSSIHVNINALQVVSSQLKLIHRMSDLDLRFRQGREPDFFFYFFQFIPLVWQDQHNVYQTNYLQDLLILHCQNYFH